MALLLCFVMVWNPRVVLTFSKSIFLTTFVQYNNQVNNVNVNTRFLWRFKPVSDLFVVYITRQKSTISFLNLLNIIMSKYYHLVVKEVISETPDTITISFWHPVHQAVSYKPGQFLTLMPVINGQKVRRSYSMSSSPHSDASLAVTVKRVPTGLVSNWLNDHVRVGDAIEVMEPMGNFTPVLDAKNRRQVVLFGAGSGITPLISIAKSVLTIEVNSRVTMVYGNRNEYSIIFKKQLDELRQKFGERLTVIHVLSQPLNGWEGYTGRISGTLASQMLAKLPNFDVRNTEFYLCGPEGMMHEVETCLVGLQVPKERIRKENFLPASGEATEVEDEEDGSLKTQIVTIKYEGSDYEVEVKPHQTILEAALELDIDLPYSCQAGMCTACMGKCVNGKVKMDEEDGLTDKEIKQGYVLTCVSHPLSKGVVIEIE